MLKSSVYPLIEVCSADMLLRHSTVMGCLDRDADEYCGILMSKGVRKITAMVTGVAGRLGEQMIKAPNGARFDA